MGVRGTAHHKGPRVRLSGTARELSEHADGYAGSGVSIYTRASAHSAGAALKASLSGRRRNVEGVILDTEASLAKLKAQAARLRAGADFEKVMKATGIKQQFLVKLYRERSGGDST